MTDCRRAATALPGVDTLAVLAAAVPAGLSPAELVDAVIVAERLLAHVNGLQVRLLAESGRPNRCADVSLLVAALVDKAGAGRRHDGQVDPEVVAEETADRSIGVAAAEVAAVLDCSPITARIRITQAMRMVSALPGTAAALERGLLDVGRARMIVDRTAVLAAELCGPIERRILPLAAGRSKARLETLVDREVIAADPAAAEIRRLAAVQGRSVSHRVDKDGMGVINALLPAEAAVLVFTLVDLIAAANKGLDGRSVDQRRADAIADIADELLTHGFVDLDGLIACAEDTSTCTTPADACGAADAADPDAGAPDAGAPDAAAPDAGAGEGHADADAGVGRDAAETGSGSAVVAAADPAESAATADAGDAALVGEADRSGRLARAMTRHGRRPHLNVTGAWTTLAGLDDLPGHLDGYGTITADLLRSIAKSWGTVTAVGVDPATGTASAVGGLTYRPGRRVSDQVIAVSGTCRAAGCRIPADKCDLDHVEAFNHRDPAAGGRTTLVNQLPECRFHHLLKHHTDWTPHLLADMTVVWTTATGHTATSHPREFTGPGEWERAAHSRTERRSSTGDVGAGGVGAGGVGVGGDVGGGDVGGGDVSSGGAGRSEGGALPAAEYSTSPSVHSSGRQLDSSERAPDQHLIIGPVVAGPTIPVVPAGTDYQEPHTALEDPATVPHPGSVEINTYRALREDTRRHALRRIGRLAKTIKPPSDTGPETERQELDRHYRTAQQRPGSREEPIISRRPSLLDLIASNDPLPDEPPF